MLFTPERRSAAPISESEPGAVREGRPALAAEADRSSNTVAIEYRSMATLQTNPPSLSQYGGTSVQPPPRSIRVGARATIVLARAAGDIRELAEVLAS